MGRSKEIWVKQDGTELEIGQMKDSHLINTINMLRRAGRLPRFPDLLEEVEYRGITETFCNRTSNAHRMYHAIQKVCPCARTHTI